MITFVSCRSYSRTGQTSSTGDQFFLLSISFSSSALCPLSFKQCECPPVCRRNCDPSSVIQPHPPPSITLHIFSFLTISLVTFPVLNFSGIMLLMTKPPDRPPQVNTKKALWQECKGDCSWGEIGFCNTNHRSFAPITLCPPEPKHLFFLTLFKWPLTPPPTPPLLLLFCRFFQQK